MATTRKLKLFIGLCLLETAFVSLLSASLPNRCLAFSFQQDQILVADLTELSLEDLMNIEVTSAGKKLQKLSDAAAAIFVITGEDIRRSGVSSIPVALRMVPGLQVARIDANKWAITCRGFNGRFANKLLVMMDGRTVYDPVFSGVFWDVQDTLLEDIDRIEVIRGPGATLWGANAVNGVINIITKHTKDTQGGLIAGGVGTEERGFSSVRYGEKSGEKGTYRIYAKYFDREEAADAEGHAASDDWRMFRAGFRMDWEPSDRNMFTFQGDIYDGEAGQKSDIPSFTSPTFTEPIEDDFPVFGGNLLSRWQHIFSGTSDMTLQLYYDRTERDEIFGNADRDTLDIDFQHRFSWGNRQEVIWGLGYRLTSDEISTGNSFVVFDPVSRTDHLFSGFIQDDITLIKDRLRLTLGSKFEHNDYTGFEIEPNARILWTPHESHSIWSAASRAVRTPSRYETDVQAILIDHTVFGNSDLKSEDIFALELGYRVQPTDSLSFDIAGFYNHYENLRTTELKSRPLNSIPLNIECQFDNKMEGDVYGLELAADWKMLAWWQLNLAYTFLKMDLKPDKDSQADGYEEDNSPDHQVSLRSSMDLTNDLELDFWLRFVDNIQKGNVDTYTTLDVRLGWQPSSNLEISLVGQNLIDRHHLEFNEQEFVSESTEVERSVYGKITFKF